jgi:UDP-2,3-diacylglucosamine hydrolase
VQRVQALPHWQRVDLISDVHLQASELATAQAWEHYLSHCSADALFILGDLFEVWVGDDILHTPSHSAELPGQAFAQRCAQALRQLTHTRPVYVMHGNRDFLLGPGFAAHTGCTLLDDPCTLDFGPVRYLLTHGDAWCLADKGYQAFRAQAYKAGIVGQGMGFADVDETTALNAMANTGSHVLIHGHTHQPATHTLGKQAQRVVMSDWDALAAPARLQVLSLDAQGGIERRALPA